MDTMNPSESQVPDNDDLAYVEAVVRRSGTSFFWAMRTLPEEKRQAMYAIYAFCREVDDIADDPGEESEKMDRLGKWRAEIERIFDGSPQLPTSRALVGPAAQFGLRKQDFLSVIDGMEMDAGRELRLADMEALFLYCDRVACAVGRLSNQVFGVDRENGDRIALALGQALQLTNILRDLHEDGQRNRLYLPESLLRTHGMTDLNPLRVLAHPGLAGVCQELAELARRRFGEAVTGLATCDRRQMRPAILMMQVYRRTFDRLMRRGWQDITKPVSLSKVEKLWVVLRYGFV